MPRDKKPKKNKYTDPKTGEFRHTDGDRRHKKFGAAAKDAVKRKKQIRELGGALPTDDTEDKYMDDQNDTTDESDENA
jgi:hypothetical protein